MTSSNGVPHTTPESNSNETNDFYKLMFEYHDREYARSWDVVKIILTRTYAAYSVIGVLVYAASRSLHPRSFTVVLTALTAILYYSAAKFRCLELNKAKDHYTARTYLKNKMSERYGDTLLEILLRERPQHSEIKRLLWLIGTAITTALIVSELYVVLGGQFALRS